MGLEYFMARFPIIFLILFGGSQALIAFPEMVRHGYGSCTTCHVSPDGGGVLTPYGRALSAEALSTWGSGNEHEPAALYGLVPTSEAFQLGGDVRWIQTLLDNPSVRRSRSILMQADVEVAVKESIVTVAGTVGYRDPGTSSRLTDALISRRHYVTVGPVDGTTIRAGRFYPAYGLRLPDHAVEIKRGLNWDFATESYNLELSWAPAPWEAFATLIGGRPDSPSLNREKGGALRGAISLSESYKLGFSYFYGTNDSGRRHVLGPYAILGFTKRFFVLAEVDLQNSFIEEDEEHTWTLVDYVRLNYELIRGVVAFLTQEFSGLTSNTSADRQSYGVGLQFFPRPHFELQTVYQRRINRAVSEEWNHFGYLMLHLYL